MIIIPSAHETWFKIILLLKVTFSLLPGPSWPPPPMAFHSPSPPTPPAPKPFLFPTPFAKGWQPQDTRSHEGGGGGL